MTAGLRTGTPQMSGNPRRAVRNYESWPTQGGRERIPSDTFTVPYIDPADGLWKVRRESHPEWAHRGDSIPLEELQP